MNGICFPHHRIGEFGSLREAYLSLRKKDYGWTWFTLTDIVQNNIGYRDYLRTYGIEALVKRIKDEVPELTNDRKEIEYLCEWTVDEKLAKYDIQCYNIQDEVTILGHTFGGLKDIQAHVELRAREGYGGMHCYAPSAKRQCEGVHVGHLYQNYPVFDSSDLCDDRTYQNYIFRVAPISEDDMKEAFKTTHSFNFCMVHESISEEMLPILYYRGDGKYMLLATAKRCSRCRPQ